MPGDFNGDDTITELTKKQIEILKEKYLPELILIGSLLIVGKKKDADYLAFKIMAKEGLL